LNYSFCQAELQFAKDKRLLNPVLRSWSKYLPAHRLYYKSYTKVTGVLIITSPIGNKKGRFTGKIHKMREQEQEFRGSDMGLVIFVFTTIWLFLFHSNIFW
jgi:hypothetical protein